MVEEMKIAPCPWCGETHYINTVLDHSLICVMCTPCGMRGPEMKIEADAIAAWNKLSHATELACAAEVLAAWGCQQEAHGIEMVRCAGSKTYRSTITSYTGGGIAIVERGVTPAAALIELAKQVRK